MAEADLNFHLNPITLESQVFLQTLEWHGPKNQVVDIELLNTMDKLIDAINKFYDQCKTQIEESTNLKLVKANELDFILRAYTCKRCQKYLGPSAEKAAKHVTEYHAHFLEPEQDSYPKNKSEVTKVKKDKTKKPQQDGTKKPKAHIQPEVKLPKKARAMVTEKISKFFREPLKTAEELRDIPIYDEIENDLLKAVKPLYPDKCIKVYKFGSRMCGIGSENSDLDIFIDIDNTFYNFENRASQKTKDAIAQVCGALNKDKNWMKVLAIENARVPIIRTVHHDSRISCDLGFSNSLGPCNTLLMDYFFELQPIASRMCIYLKKWTQRTKLSDVFSTYGLTLIIIYFLQRTNRLPSLQILQDEMNDDEKLFVGPWISNFQKRTLSECSLKPVIQPTKANFQNIMADIFSWIGSFDFENFVICPYIGNKTSIKECTAKMPKRYTDFVLNNGPQSELQLNKPCVVQDPIQLNHNVTKNISLTMLKLFVNFAKESACLLDENKENEENDVLN